jgi:flavin-dependent dehydrogenase
MHVASVHRSRADRILKVAPPEAFHPDWTVRGYIMKLARQPSLADQLSPSAADSTGLSLDDGSRVAVVGGGPAGSLFSFFLLKMAESLDLELDLDIYEPRRFTHCGPAGCNHCGGIISESLVQILATEGINLPPSVIQRGIESYVVHMDIGSVQIESPAEERRIAAVYRGNGPKEAVDMPWDSFDGYLQQVAEGRGATVVHKLVDGIEWEDGFPSLKFPGGRSEPYDLVVLATGVNSNLLRQARLSGETPSLPKTTRTFICEFQSDQETILREMGNSMHVFLLPKGDYITLCLLGDDIDAELVESFLDDPAVRRCLPSNGARRVCHCAPLMNIKRVGQPYGDRVVMIGDCGVTRLYKDGIGGAYRTAKAAAEAAILHGVSADDFKRHYWPACRAIDTDNSVGRVIFLATELFKKVRFTRRAVLRMTRLEQENRQRGPHMSGLLWNMFTGSAPYKEIFVSALHPAFLGGFLWNLAIGLARPGGGKNGSGPSSNGMHGNGPNGDGTANGASGAG